METRAVKIFFLVDSLNVCKCSFNHLVRIRDSLSQLFTSSASPTVTERSITDTSRNQSHNNWGQPSLYPVTKAEVKSNEKCLQVLFNERKSENFKPGGFKQEQNKTKPPLTPCFSPPLVLVFIQCQGANEGQAPVTSGTQDCTTLSMNTKPHGGGE